VIRVLMQMKSMWVMQTVRESQLMIII